MAYPALPLDQLIRGDCLSVLAEFPESSVDLIFADPPYNLQLQQDLWRPNMTKVDAVDDDWDRFSSFEAYDLFTRQWLTACRRVLNKDGTIWVIGTYHNIYRLGTIMQDLGFWILNDVVWIKTNPMPNFRGVRLTNAHETLLWAAKTKTTKYTFNHHTAKVFNNGKQLRSDWYLPICSGAERLKVDGKKAHSTQKPEGLLERVITISSKVGDVVLDPFFGSGTTGAVAKRLLRHWIGIEKAGEYIDIARERIEKVVPDMFAQSPDLRDELRHKPRASFSTLVSKGLLVAGQRLYFRRERSKAATINADASLTFDGYTGSIHQVGRHIMGGSPCNGWDHWYFEGPHDELRLLDEVRQSLDESPSKIPSPPRLLPNSD